MLVGFITNYPEIISNQREKVDFIIFKYRMEDEDYKILLRKLILAQKLDNLKNYYKGFSKSKNEQEKKYFIEHFSRCHEQVIVLREYFNDKSHAQEKDIIGFVEDFYDERLLSGDVLLPDFICQHFESKFFKIIKNIAKCDGLIYYKLGNNLIKSDLFNFVNTKLVTIEDALNKVNYCKFDETQLIEHCFNKQALEIKFTLRSRIDLKELNDHYLFYRVVQNIPFEIQLYDSIKEDETESDPSDDFIAYAIYPSGSMRLFGELHFNNGKIFITEEELELFFDPDGLFKGNKIEHFVEYKFWIILLGF